MIRSMRPRLTVSSFGQAAPVNTSSGLPVSMAEIVLEIVAPLGIAAVAILVLIDRQAAARDTKLWPFQLIAVGGVLFALLAIGQRL